MKVFISWSGERSKAVANALHDWIPYVINAVQPWMSEVDIDKGARWYIELANQLEDAQVGIICLTPDNLNAPYILFEAGALSKKLEKTYVCTYLFGVGPEDITGPLEHFQHTKADKNDTRKLIYTINKALQEQALKEELLKTAFEKWWPDLEEKLDNVPDVQMPPGKPIGNPNQGKPGILIDLSHNQLKWPQTKAGSIFELMKPERKLVSLIHPSGDMIWDIQELKDDNQFSSEDLVNWKGMIFGITKAEERISHRINQNVCNAIVRWVHQGGHLLLLGYELGDKHHKANLNQLAQKFGLWFNSDIVGPEDWNNPKFKPYLQDIQFNAEAGTSNIITDIDPNRHRILNEVRKLTFRKTCTLNAEAGTSNIITVGNNRVCKWPTAIYNEEGWTDSGMQIFDIITQASWVPVVAEAPRSLTRKGSVIAIGTWDFFGNDECFKNADNYRFVNNLLGWLAGELD
ncbi:MAG: toll/interleukin-1 receptor domain-containing protein [Candidatus Methanoperedens sp.]|nr:toll/interleukin-1 receptor domain-containing protein [Candidatus Methanoperedens sp.]